MQSTLTCLRVPCCKKHDHKSTLLQSSLQIVIPQPAVMPPAGLPRQPDSNYHLPVDRRQPDASCHASHHRQGHPCQPSSAHLLQPERSQLNFYHPQPLCSDQCMSLSNPSCIAFALSLFKPATDRLNQSARFTTVVHVYSLMHGYLCPVLKAC